MIIMDGGILSMDGRIPELVLIKQGDEGRQYSSTLYTSTNVLKARKGGCLSHPGVGSFPHSPPESYQAQVFVQRPA